MLHKLHRTSALFLGAFIFFHLVNHLFILGGVQQHIALMEMFRIVYRNILVESFLLVCVLFQACSGVYFVWKRRGQRRGFLEKAQAISGLYLAFFLINHVGSVLFFGRIYADLDTNIYFGLVGFHVDSLYLFFVPYYFLAVVSLFVHIASAFNWLTRKKLTENRRMKLAYLIITIGVIISFTLILGFSGIFGDIQIPTEYKAIYG